MEGPALTARWEDLVARVGSVMGCSAWQAIEQPRIDTFASLTGDRYFLHVDPQRAAQTPFGGTIAHGLMTLSLLAEMSYQVCPFVEGARYPLNYGFDRVRFVAPVKVGSRVRGCFTLLRAEAVTPQQRQLAYDVTIEIEGQQKPALVAHWLTRFIV